MKTTCALSLIATTILGLVLIGCDSVTSTTVIGEPWVGEVEGASIDMLEGVWSVNEAVIYIQPSADGHLRIAFVEFKEGEFKLNRWDAEVTVDDNALYLNLVQQSDDGESADAYSPLRMIVSDGDSDRDDTLIFLPPVAAAFEKLVKDGKIKGEVTREKHSVSVHLTDDKKVLEQLIHPDHVGQQFKVDAPVVLKRIGKFDTDRPAKPQEK